MDCDLETTIPEWIIEHPDTMPVFDQLGLDTSCGGKSLRYVCQHRGLNPSEVLQTLYHVIRTPPEERQGSRRRDAPN
ncbi:hypothetical protein CA51_04830 [Rosistilla oblonga]|uniref:DUF542 domain-containing protein n=1 Tax=Rosistilla oblonga TaxID=2527990 RepID=UPI00118B66EC|nr:DUF542 domain-containing protein [Rosistilla oblonga]QDV10633.1 hypothetical protein CA51_04830 [Rosistilla oblonga]